LDNLFDLIFLYVCIGKLGKQILFFSLKKNLKPWFTKF